MRISDWSSDVCSSYLRYLNAAAFTTLTFLVRLLHLVLTLPLILLAAFVGLVDGLVRRDVRKFGAGRESGFFYHRATARSEESRVGKVCSSTCRSRWSP